MTSFPRHPAQIDAYVDALGPELAARFLIEFGGCVMYFPEDPKGRSLAEQMIGAERLKALSLAMPDNRGRVPIPRVWLVHVLNFQGKTVSEICRTLKVTDPTVRSCLKKSPHGGSLPETPTPEHEPDPDQLSLF